MRKIALGRTKAVLAIALLAAATAFGGLCLAEEGQGEFGIQGGVAIPDGDLSDDGWDINNMSPLIGIRGGYQWAEDWNWFADLNFSPLKTDLIEGDADSWMLRTGVERYLTPQAKDFRWFVGGGVGLMDVDMGGSGSGFEDFDRMFASLGFGQQHQGAEGKFRWEVRADHTLDDDGLGGEDLTTLQALFGYAWNVGGAPKDADGDGVIDRKDRCPDTPRGATVDENGCPMDSDKDGVLDGLDKCPETPEGWPVNSDGCALDSDGDGVVDGLDKCPDTPKGATVDETGCPKDSDGDGVYDGLDKCPDTPKGAAVDSNGCPKDSDRDGVYDGLDKCPKTPAGTEVDEKGCAKPKKIFAEKRTLVLEGVNFELDSSKLTSTSLTILNEAALSLKAWPEVRIEVGGHTDSQGSARYNEQLSAKRAEAVRQYLISKGVKADRIEARGYGESTPLADNGDKAGRAKNRRVELKKL